VMEELVFSDICGLQQAIQQIYSLDNLETFGVEAIAIMNQVVPSDIPSFHYVSLETQQLTDTFLPGFAGFTPEMKLARQETFGEHPIIQNMPMALNGAYKISDFATVQEFHSLEGVYQRYLRPLGIEDHMILCLPFIPMPNPISPLMVRPLIGLGLHRSERSFTERDRLMLNLLRPHFFQAYGNAQQHQQVQQTYSQLGKSLGDVGLVILDLEGQVELMTPLAINWLEKYFAPAIGLREIPDLLWSWVKHHVTELAEGGVAVPLQMHQGQQKLVVRLTIKAAENRYLLLLEEERVSIVDSLDLLGLSRRETDVLAGVIQGLDNPAIAVQMGVNIYTVRKHLENIYSKLGVKSRAGAIAYTLQKLGLLNS
jgi:DNA-binding CsgD family transcriptional regulator